MQNHNKIKYLNIFLLLLLVYNSGYYFLVFREGEIKKSILRSKYVEINLGDYKKKIDIKKEEEIEIKKFEVNKEKEQGNLNTDVNKESKKDDLNDKAKDNFEERIDESRKEDKDEE